MAVIRVSGPGAGQALRLLTGKALPPARRATRARLKAFRSVALADDRGSDDAAGEVIDDGLVLWFPGPRSFTGEDLAEFHVHGGRAVVAALLAALTQVSGLRPAGAGEFTRRAFENGKLDLTQAEGLADLVRAETEAQRRLALVQTQGGLGRLYESWRQRLIAGMAQVEASIDFADEDVPKEIDEQVRHDLGKLVTELDRHLADGHRGERIRDGIGIAVIGAPNAGKSSLVNRLAGRDVAIVSPHAGTTRDVIEVPLDLGGYPVVLADTAGLRKGQDDIELEGVARARTRALAADIRLAVFDGSVWPKLDGETVSLVDSDAVVVVNKADLGGVSEPISVKGRPGIAVSALTGEGMERVVSELRQVVTERYGNAAEPCMTRARHRDALEGCRQMLVRAQEATVSELLAEDMRMAARALGRITGRVDVEEVLDVIFRDFCIGK